MKDIIYSVIISHEAEAHENYLYTSKDMAIAKMDEVVERWRDGRKCNEEEFKVIKYNDDLKTRANFTPQYKTKLGYWYQYGEWEYGCVELIECVLDVD